ARPPGLPASLRGAHGRAGQRAAHGGRPAGARLPLHGVPLPQHHRGGPRGRRQRAAAPPPRPAARRAPSGQGGGDRRAGALRRGAAPWPRVRHRPRRGVRGAGRAGRRRAHRAEPRDAQGGAALPLRDVRDGARARGVRARARAPCGRLRAPDRRPREGGGDRLPRARRALLRVRGAPRAAPAHPRPEKDARQDGGAGVKRRLLGLAAILLAGTAGALLGLAMHSAFLLATKTAHTLPRALHWPWTTARQAMVLGAALVSLLLASRAAGLLRWRDLARDLMGAGVGAAAGFILYALGYLAAGHPTGAAGGFYAMDYWGVLDTLTVAELIAAVLGGVVGLIVIRFGWRLYGVLASVAFVSIVAGYFGYVFNVALPRVPLQALPISIFLLWAEGMSLAMVVVHAYYGLDDVVKRRWERTPDKVPFSRHYLPRVAFHYACFNEPPEIVFDALSRFKDLDYPKDRYVVMVLDDSTDERCRAPVERFCRENGFVYVHRANRKGYKAGALNNALRLTPPDVEVISVIDADYHLEPEYLRETVGYFIDPRLGFLQTPQDYRNVHQSFLTRQYYFADGYFYRAIMPSRNEANAISFCGTMGMVRREALEQVGGWAENHVTEDCELSVRLLDAGWRSLFIPKTFGKGLIPPTYDA